jgi:hypothetical protein
LSDLKKTARRPAGRRKFFPRFFSRQTFPHSEKKKMKKFQSMNGLALLLLLLGARAATAQDMDVQGDGSNFSTILRGKNINPGLTDNVGVVGYSVPAGYWGIGLEGNGGYMGTYSTATASGNGGYRYGVDAAASGGDINYGVYGWASGPTAYGVYGSAAVATNSWGVYCNGKMAINGVQVNASDERLKKNIASLTGNLPKLLRLKPVHYEFRTDEFKNMNLVEGKHMGLIAQDVETVYPELVYDGIINPGEPPVKKDGRTPLTPSVENYKGVDYISLIPVLIGAIQEQQAQIDNLQAQLAKLKK